MLLELFKSCGVETVASSIFQLGCLKNSTLRHPWWHCWHPFIHHLFNTQTARSRYCIYPGRVQTPNGFHHFLWGWWRLLSPFLIVYKACSSSKRIRSMFFSGGLPTSRVYVPWSRLSRFFWDGMVIPPLMTESL